VTYIAPVLVVSRDHPLRIDAVAVDDGPCRARNVERGERPVGSPQEALKGDPGTRERVVVSRDRPRRVNAAREGAVGAWSLKDGKGTVRSANEALKRIVVLPDRPSRIDGRGE
jgi:hypothetical protein